MLTLYPSISLTSLSSILFVNFGIIILQNILSKSIHSSVNTCHTTCFQHLFQSFSFLFYTIFQPICCNMHLFALLFRAVRAIFHRPENGFQWIKYHINQPFSHQIDVILILFVRFLAAQKSAFCIISPCVLHHFTLRLAAKRTAFNSKTHCVQLHITRRFGAKCSAFSYKKLIFSHKFRFSQQNMLTSTCTCPCLLCIQTNLRENRKFAPE